jgi:hypothetical protein
MKLGAGTLICTEAQPNSTNRTFDVLYAHSQVVRLGEMEIRTFGAEDHLRLLCLQFLREGGLARPLWLSDISVALKSGPADFNWDYFLSGDRQRSDWAACAIDLAHSAMALRWKL